MKKIGVVVAVLIVGLVWAGAEAQPIKNPDTFIEGSGNSLETLDPQFASSAATMFFLTNIYEGLLGHAYGNRAELVTALATVVPTIDNGLITTAADGRTFISLPIREGVKFQNGATLTPEDVEYTYERAILVGAPHSVATYLFQKTFASMVEEIGYGEAYDMLDEAIEVSGNTITFKLVEPFVLFVDSLTSPILNKAWCLEQGCWPGTKETGEAYMDLSLESDPLAEKAMGTGPYRLESVEPMERYVLEAFEDYWQGAPRLKRAIRQIITDAQTQILMLQNGDIDFISVGSSNLPLVEGSEGITVLTNLPSPWLLKLNMIWELSAASTWVGDGELGSEGIPLDFFSDIDVRKAFAYSFDWDTFINDVMLGYVVKATGPVPQGFPSYNPDNPTYSLDLEKAEEHFKKAWGGELWDKGFYFIAPSSGGWRTDALQILIDNIQSINPEFKIDIVTVPWATYVASYNQKLTPLMLFGMLPDVLDPYMTIAFDMASDWRYAQVCGYADFAKEHYDPLILELGTNYDQERRWELSRELQQMAYEFAHTIYLYQAVNHVAYRDWVQGYVPGEYPWQLVFYELSKGD